MFWDSPPRQALVGLHDLKTRPAGREGKAIFPVDIDWEFRWRFPAFLRKRRMMKTLNTLRVKR